MPRASQPAAPFLLPYAHLLLALLVSDKVLVALPWLLLHIGCIAIRASAASVWGWGPDDPPENP